MKHLFVYLLLSCLVLSACVKNEIIDKITMPIVVGYDKAEHNQFQYTVAVPIIKPDQSVSNIIYSASSHTIRNSRQKLVTQIRKPYSEGKVSIALFSNEVAKEGIARILDKPIREPRISKRLYLAVVDGQVKDLLESDFSFEAEKGEFIHDLINNNIKKGDLPRTNIHQFEYSLLGKGMDPYLPLLQKQNNSVTLSGLALFKDDKYTAAISLDQLRVFRLMLEDVDHGNFEVALDQHSYAVLENHGSKVRYQLSGSNEKPKVTINLKLNVTIPEFSGFTLTEQDRLNIEKTFAQQITDKGKSLLNNFQKLRIDPLGIGNFVRSQTKNWEERKWKQQYPYTQIGLNVDVDVVGTGVAQ